MSIVLAIFMIWGALITVALFCLTVFVMFGKPCRESIRFSHRLLFTLGFGLLTTVLGATVLTMAEALQFIGG